MAKIYLRNERRSYNRDTRRAIKGQLRQFRGERPVIEERAKSRAKGDTAEKQGS